MKGKFNLSNFSGRNLDMTAKKADMKIGKICKMKKKRLY